MISKSKFQPTRLLRGCTLLFLGLSLLRLPAAGSTFSDANWSRLASLPGANGFVTATAVDDAGNLYIGGNFTIVGDVVANGIAKWDGTKWSALGSGVNGAVSALAVSGSDLYVGGASRTASGHRAAFFTTAGGVAATNIAKWDGTNWSALGSGIEGDVWALAVSGSHLYAGGWFTTAGGIAATNIAQWDGTDWSALGSGVGDDPNNYPYVYALAVSGHDVYAGGGFTNMGGIAANHIAKWDGSSWSELLEGVGNKYERVYALAVSGSDVYAGGLFHTADIGAANNIARWDGSNWSALDSGVGDLVLALAASGSNLYAGGYFALTGDTAVNSIAKWDGSSWSALGSGFQRLSWDEFEPYPVLALAVFGHDLYAGGNFNAVDGSAANHIAKWNGNNWSALGSGLGASAEFLTGTYVAALAVSNSDVYAGGLFSTAGDEAAHYIAKGNGSSWSALGSGVNGGYFPRYRNPLVAALAVSGHDVYAGGKFTTAGGNPATNIAQWDGNNWSPLGEGVNAPVSALAVLGRDLYAGGSFSTAGGSPANGIAKWEGGSWSILGSGLERTDGSTPFVSALAASGNDLYVGGWFTTAGGIAATHIAKWNGSSWSALGSGMNNEVTALVVSGHNLYAGGYFTTAGGSPANHIAKWDGSNWSALGSGLERTDGDTPSVSALAVFDSDLYAAGTFTVAGGETANYIARWNGTSWSALGTGMNGFVSALAVSGNDLYVGGGFTMAGGKVSAYLARAYLLDLPVLSVHRSGSDLIASWSSADSAGFALEWADALGSLSHWVALTAQITDDGVKKSVTVPASHGPQFFRLRRP